MPAAKPVIGTRIGGIKETGEQGAGILVLPGSAEQLHAAIQQLIENPSLRTKMGIAGKKHAEKYNEPNITRLIIQTYFTPGLRRFVLEKDMTIVGGG